MKQKIISWLPALVSFFFPVMIFAQGPPVDVRTLKDAYRDAFMIGTAVTGSVITDSTSHHQVR